MRCTGYLLWKDYHSARLADCPLGDLFVLPPCGWKELRLPEWSSMFICIGETSLVSGV